MADFKISYSKTKQFEGGYAHVDGDTGEETYAGISRKWFPKWEGWAVVDKHKPLTNNQHIKDSNLDKCLEDFYKKEFWDKINGDAIPLQKMADEQFDMAVNAGIRTAKNLVK